MSRITSFLLGILSAITLFIMMTVFALSVIVVLIPINFNITEWGVLMLAGTILFAKLMLIVLASILVVTILVYLIGTPQYFRYLDQEHNTVFLAIHKWFNLIVAFFAVINVSKRAYHLIFSQKMYTWADYIPIFILIITLSIGLLTHPKKQLIEP